MRSLGFQWQQQTLAAVETAKRRATAEEIFGLALALETTIAALMSASDQDGEVQLPGGIAIGAVSVERLAGLGSRSLHPLGWSDRGAGCRPRTLARRRPVRPGVAGAARLHGSPGQVAPGPSRRGGRGLMARRARRGGGSVYWDASRGCYVGAVSMGGGPVGGKRIRRKVSVATEAECWDKLDELLQEKKRTGAVAKRDTTVERIVRDRLANEPQTVRSPITRRVHAGHAERIIAAIGKIKIVQLTPGQVEQRLLWKMAKTARRPRRSATPGRCSPGRSAAPSGTAWSAGTSPS